ncbi:SpvB/TcaC N-terminal domain-containing protein [Pseudomonas entomophila]|uniref:SpvB/TcaC N-terminal domain-containing protein n=1 Tax=Pseudomonas entomophila TaxID=312306 RepID=UPI0024071FF8|nr:SpvB/TcaC N-terminal domain-containing protein [Pseudomonas entomophila]MDF9617566.1 SpvB/TcaC N-terminal domain-containing protein [Pseudomonas entomophila]
MPEQSASVPEESRAPFYTPPTLPKGGGTVSVGGGMLSAGGPDGSAGWQLPLPSPAGRSLSAALTLQYSSGGGNSAFGAGWECPLPAVFVMTRFGFPKYDGNDRMVGPSGEEILKSGEAADDALLKRSGIAGQYNGTSWRARTFSQAERLEHWVPKATPTHPGFWLHVLPDNSLSLYGWSPSARLQETEEPGNPTPRRVAGWYIEETLSSSSDDHLVYRYRNEDEEGCSTEEKQAHPRVANVYPDTVYARYFNNVSKTLLIPTGAFKEGDFLEFAQFYYGEFETGPGNPPPPPRTGDQKIEWPVREDPHSFWRYGFNVRLRRRCQDVLLWRRTNIFNGDTDTTPEWVSHLHLSHDSSPLTSLLESAEQITHDPRFRMPPLEFWMSRPGRKIRNRQANDVKANDWEPLPSLDGFWQPNWQMADLYGEGIPGMLYLDNGAWHYREPQRLDNPAGKDLVTWGKAMPLAFPLQGSDGMLADLDSDGQPEWLVITNSLRGSFTLAPDGTWGTLVPLAGLPGEYAHPLARRADLTGNSQDDVVLLRALGPRTVRLYPANGTKGWMAALNEEYQGSEPLPSLDDSEHQLVAFADPAGSGQQHLVRITGNGVTLWPSLGHGRFDNALRIDGFAVENFNASRVFLADTDGSGTTDILYMSPDGIQVFVSQCGNQYSKGVFIPAPVGVVLDETCQLQVADIHGQGTADLLLTRLHGGEGNQPQSWLYRFNDHRPWLLGKVSDNAGTCTHLRYRSSAQAWLDHKADVLARTGRAPVSYLPFPVHTVSRVTTINEITGLSLGSETTYLGGVWDGQEREFAGFSRLIQRDTNEQAQLASADLSPTSRTCTWFHTGIEARDLVTQGAFVDIDAHFPQEPVRFTHWTGGSEQPLEPTPSIRPWLYRAVRGQVRRIEVYGEDSSEQADKPYSVVTNRLQVRLHDTADAERPAALVTPVEILTFACERITEDPVVNQAIVLEQDEYGNVLQSAAINYPRLLSPAALAEEDTARRIYPKALPEGLITASCDDQQYGCWINLTRATVHNLTADGDWAIGLPGSTRSDAVLIPSSEIPKGGYSIGNWPDLPSKYADRFTLTGYQKVLWRKTDGSGISGTPSVPALVAYTRTAMLDEASVEALQPTFELTLQQLVTDALNTPNADPAVLTRVHQRVPTPDAETLYAVLMLYLSQRSPLDTEACQVLRGALKQIISVASLCQKLKDATAGTFSEALRTSLSQQSRVPDAELAGVMLWYAQQQEVPENDLKTLYLTLASTMPETVFWRCVLFGCQSQGPYPAAHLPTREWLDGVRSVLDGQVQEESLEDLLKRGGYIAMRRPADAPELDEPHDPAGLGAPGIPFEPAIAGAYAGHHGITLYHDEAHFWLPKTVQENTVTGPVQLAYTAHDIAVNKVTDAAGLSSEVKAYDWRFLTPIEILDANDNTSKVALDTMGRVRHTRFHGTETAAGETVPKNAGYDPDRPFEPPLTVEDAVKLNDSKNVPVAQAFTVIADSWMPLKLLADGSRSDQRCSEREWQRDAERLQRDGIVAQPTMEGRAPPHVIQIQTDRYDDDPQQQVRVQVMLNGGGQVLQTAIRNPEGEAFVFDTETGGLKTDDDGNALIEHAAVRWAVTGKTEFDNKGQPVRVWLPFYLNDWHWVSNDSARKNNEGIYADTHIYDALGRECKVVRAAGEAVDGEWANYEQRVQAYPWFTVAEDENDTWKDVIERAKRKRGQ